MLQKGPPTSRDVAQGGGRFPSRKDERGEARVEVQVDRLGSAFTVGASANAANASGGKAWEMKKPCA